MPANQHVLELAERWLQWADVLELVVGPELVLAVRRIWGGILGEAERLLADRLAQYVVNDPVS